MATENLDVLIGGSWKKDEADFAKTVDNMVGHIDRLTKAGKGLKIDLGLSNKDFGKIQVEASTIINELRSRIRELEKATKDNTQAQIAAEKVAQQATKTDRETIKTLREKNKQMYELAKQQRELEKQIAKEEAAIKKQQSAYQLLNVEYQKRAAKAKDLATIYGTEDTMAKRAAESANKLNERLKAIDATVGQSQRNVGNYKSAWNGVQNSIGQMVREVPSTINNLSMLPLALSNNIGGLKDALEQARVKNIELKAAGEKTIPVWKQAAAAIFSWETALMLGVAALVYYSSKTDEAEKKAGDFADAVKSASGDYAEARIKLEAWGQALKDTATTTSQKEAILKEYNATLGEHMGKQTSVLGLEKRIAEAGPAYIEAMKHRALAAAALAASMDILTESMKNQSNGGRDLLTWEDKLSTVFRFSGQGDAYRKAKADRLAQDKKDADDRTKNLEKIINENQAKANAIISKFGFNFDPKTDKPKKEKDAKDLTNIIIELQKEANDALAVLQSAQLDAEAGRLKQASEDEKTSLDQRLIVYEQYYSRKTALAEIENQKELEEAKLQRDKLLHQIEESNATPEDKKKAKLQIEETYAKQVLAINATLTQSLADLETQSIEDRKKITESSIKEQLRIIMQGAQDIENTIRDRENKNLIILDEFYNAGNIKYADYQKKRKQIQVDADNESAAATRQYLLNWLDDLEKKGKLTAEIATKLRTEIAKGGGGKQQNSDKGIFFDLVKSVFGDLSDEQINGIVSAYTQAFGQIYSSLQQAAANRRSAEIDALELEIEKTKERYELEVDYINKLSVTDEERKRKLDEAAARQNLREISDRQKMGALKRKHAEAEKNANIADTLGKGAIAIVRAFSDLGPIAGAIAAIAIGATVAAQVATIRNTPIPQYFTGTDSAKPGLGTWGEKGTELMVHNDGSMELSPNKTTPRIFEGGEKIYNAQETAQIMKNGALKSLAQSGKKISESDYMMALIGAYENGSNRMIKAIRESKPVVTQQVIIYDNAYYKQKVRH